MPLRALIAVLVLAVYCGPALAADLIGYSEAFDTLYRIDLTTQSAQEIGRATPPALPRLANIEGLTYSPNGTLYAVSDASAVKTLLTIDPATGLASIVGNLNLTGQNASGQLDLGLAFTCDGALWLSSSNGGFWQINPANATSTYVGNLGVKITGLAAKGKALYGSGSQGNNTLYQIDPATAKATAIGAYGAGAGYITTASPAFDTSGQLWTILDYVPPPSGSIIAAWSDLATIDSSSGTLSDLGPITASGPSLADLQYIGLKGLAIASNSCVASRPGVDSTPTISWRGMLALITFLILFAGTRLRPKRPIV